MDDFTQYNCFKYIKNSYKLFVIFALICSLLDIGKLEAVVSQEMAYKNFSFFFVLNIDSFLYYLCTKKYKLLS